MALCETCKGLDPERAWMMRMDVSLRLLTARIGLIKRGEKRDRSSGEPAFSLRADGKREARFKGGYQQLVAAAKSLRGTK